MSKVYTRYNELIAQKEVIEGRRFTYKEISEDTGLAVGTIGSYRNGTVTRYDGDTLIALCNFLDCDLGDLMRVKTAVATEL